MFLFFGFAGIEVAKQGSTPGASLSLDQLLYISAAFGGSLMVNAWVFFRISGGLFNPAVSVHKLLVVQERKLIHLVGNICPRLPQSSFSSSSGPPHNHSARGWVLGCGLGGCHISWQRERMYHSGVRHICGSGVLHRNDSRC